jgi:hypothetical protein
MTLDSIVCLGVCEIVSVRLIRLGLETSTRVHIWTEFCRWRQFRLEIVILLNDLCVPAFHSLSSKVSPFLSVSNTI